MALTEQDLDLVVALERACSVISLLGCFFVLITFSVSDAFRQRAVNRMVFYATFGNMLTNVATMMTRNYTNDVNGFGCQLQAFLIQVFLQSDAYWAMAMAINVYLTFYHKFDQRRLRKMELYYLICCYGVPFIPGFTFIFVSTPTAGRPYGNAVLWCWLRPEWEIYRIATFYGPVWVSIVISIAIYLRAGRQIYLKRRKMLHFSGSGSGATTNGTVTGGPEPFSPTYEFSAANNFKTTEVVQTTEVISYPAPVGQAISTPSTKPGPHQRDPNVSYSVTISAEAPAHHHSRESVDDIDEEAVIENIHATHPANATTDAHDRAMSTTQTSITAQATAAAARRRNYDNSNAAWAYTKCSILFFSVLLITWIPSSGNRVYSMLNHNEVSKPLFFASAFVLPLQGFWNAIIYIVTSWSACKSLAATIAASLPFGMCSAARSRVSIVDITNGRHRDTRPTGGRWSKADESTSMEDLTGSSSRIEQVSPV